MVAVADACEYPLKKGLIFLLETHRRLVQLGPRCDELAEAIAILGSSVPSVCFGIGRLHQNKFERKLQRSPAQGLMSDDDKPCSRCDPPVYAIGTYRSQQKNTKQAIEGDGADGINDRLALVERSLAIRPSSTDVHRRLKLIEDRLVLIEERFPQIAAKCLHYADEQGAQKTGRVTTLPTRPASLSMSAASFQDTCKHFDSLLSTLK